jgi:hypothetical protein
MPGIAHEAPVELLRRNPLLAATLLDSLGVPLPDNATATMAPGELTSALPTELRADGVIVLTGRKARLAVVVEIQTSPDLDKRRVWPAYLVLARAQHDCPTVLLVICGNRATGRWSRRPIATGHPGFDLVPLVIDADTTPSPGSMRIPGPAPELAILGALTGAIDLGSDSGRRQVLAAIAAAHLDKERLETYTHLVRAVAPGAARKALETLMTTVFKDDFIERYKSQAMAEGWAEGKAAGQASGWAEGRAEGVAQGKAEGVAQGKAEGVAQGKASMVLRILAARGLDVPETVWDKVMSCADTGQLDRWGDAAVSAASLDDVFGSDR